MTKYLHSQKQEPILSLCHEHSKEDIVLPTALQWWWIHLQHLLHVGCESPGGAPCGLCERVSEHCVSAWVEIIVPVVFVNGLVGKGKAALAGYKFPCPCTSSPSAAAEYKR